MTGSARGTLAYNDFSGVGQGGTGTLKVDGEVVATQKMEHTMPMILQWDESFDIGSDTLTGVNDADYQPPFALTAKLNKLTLRMDRPRAEPGRHQEAAGRAGGSDRRRRRPGDRRRRQPGPDRAAGTAIARAASIVVAGDAVVVSPETQDAHTFGKRRP